MSASANIRAGRAYVEITAETSRLRRGLKGAEDRLRGFAKACSAIGREMLTLGGAMSLPFVLAERSFAGFDDRMRLVQAVTNATGEAFESLTRTAQRLGRETSFTASQVADAMVGLGRMGFSPTEIESSIGAVLNLSRATGTELSESADIAANSMRVFGLEATKMTKVSDLLTATANGSAQTLTDLFEGIKMAGPQAAAAGETLDELCASLGVMANMGIKGSLAGTALRKAFTQFADTDIQEILRSVGVESTDANGNLRKMADVMRDIAVATKNMPTAERLTFMKDVFDVRGMMSGLSLTGSTEELDAFLAKLRDVNGQADETARAMDRGIGGSFRLFASAVEGAMNATGVALNSTLQPIVDRVTAVINSFTKWIEANKPLVASIATVAAGVMALGAVLLGIGMVSRTVSTGIGAISGAFGILSGVQGALVSKGIVVQNAFGLMARAFSDYRNAAVPAIVGTSRLLAALNLPLESRAKQVAASLVLMSNAEAAAAAKSALAAKFSALAKVLKGVSAASVAAAVSAKAHAAAELFRSGVTKAATAVHAAFVAVGRALTLSHVKSAAAAGGAAVANVALAVTTKAVAAGYLAASAAASAFCAIPITWLLVAIVGALYGVCAWMSSATKHTAELSDAMQKLREKGDELRATDELRMERLQQLAEKEQLSNAEMAEAEKLAGQLKDRYGDIGVSADRAAGCVTLAADAQERFNEAMRAQAVREVENEIEELKHNIYELGEENKSLCGVWTNIWNTITFRGDKAVEEIEANGEKMQAASKKMAEAYARLDAIREGAKGSLTGGKTEREALEEKVETGKTERSATAEDAAKAAEKAAEIEKKIRRESQTELQNEIEDIVEMREEYKKLIATMLSYEKAKRNKDQARIADLEKRLAEADGVAEGLIRAAEEKSRKGFEDDVGDLRGGFADAVSDIENDRREKDTDREIEAALKEDPAFGMQMLGKLINRSAMDALAAKAEFERELESAKADGKIDDDERKRIGRAQDAYVSSEGLVDKYTEKLRAAEDALDRKAADAKPQGTFSARQAEQFRANGIERKMLDATKAIEKNTKVMANVLKDAEGPTFK